MLKNDFYTYKIYNTYRVELIEDFHQILLQLKGDFFTLKREREIQKGGGISYQIILDSLTKCLTK